METRILSGIYINRRIFVHRKTDGVRPTLSIVRKILFDILYNYLSPNYTMLDCFAGYGTVGIEALSRGASFVTFLDIQGRCLRNIVYNLDNMPKITGAYRTVNRSAMQPPIAVTPVDFIYLDPPYSKDFILKDIIKKLYKNNWIHSKTVIVCETPVRTTQIHKLLDNVYLLQERRVGSTLLSFYRILFNNS